MTGLKLTHRTQGDITIIDVDGELDVYTAPQLRTLAINLPERERRWIVIDLERCVLLDATGLGTIVGVLKRARALDGGVVVVCTGQRVYKMFRLTGLDKLFGPYETVDAACAHLSEARDKAAADA